MTKRHAISEVSCAGKHQFKDSGIARDTAKRMRSRDKSANIYRCVHCGYWHIGSRVAHVPKRKRQQSFEESSF